MKLYTIIAALEQHQPNDLSLDEFKALAQEIMDNNDVGVTKTHVVATEGTQRNTSMYILAITMFVDEIAEFPSINGWKLSGQETEREESISLEEIKDAFAEALYNLADNSRSVLKTHLAVNEAAL